MNLLHLQYFYIVAKENGFTKASKVLRIQQPAISKMVKQLEDSFGFDLFEKIGRNIRLTQQGTEVFKNCQKIFGEVEELKRSIGQISGECRGPLIMAASEPIASHYIPAALSDFLKNHPDVYPNIFSGPAALLFPDIINGKVELGLFFHTPDIPEKLEIFAQKKIRYYLVVRKDLKKNKDVIETFIGSREIDDTQTRRFPTIERMKKDYPGIKIKISSNNLTAHKELVLKGLGVSILPDFLVEKELASGKLVDLYPKEKFEFQLKMIKRKNSTLSLNASEFLKTL